MTSKTQKTKQIRLLILGCTVVIAVTAARPAAAEQVRIDIMVDMAPAGQNIPKPTPDKPAFYVPVPGGYKDLGAIIRRKVAPPPPEAEVEDIFTAAMAQQGYLRATKQRPPSLVLAYCWGTIKPILVGRGKFATVANEPDMLSMLAGDKMDANRMNHPSPWLTEVLVFERRPLRFLMVSAFDFAAWQNHKPLLLWRAHITTPGISLANIMPTLIESAAPALGAETGHPEFNTVDYVPPGSVIVGIAREKSP